MSIRIMTDSTSDIGPERAREWGITLVPLKVIFGKDEYLDGVDLPLDAFYEKLQASKQLPTTSQPAPEMFLREFEAARDAGDQVVLLTISSELSGTYQSACLAREMCGYDGIYIVDSRQVTCTILLMARRALALAKEGKTAAEIAAVLEEEKRHYCIYAVIGDLTYLEKGGRLPKAGAVAGSILNLRPLITIANTGVVKLAGMARGQSGAYGKLLKMLEADGGQDMSREFCLGYTGGIDVLQPFQEYISQRMNMDKCLVSRVGTVIGTHGGPGCAVFGAYVAD